MSIFIATYATVSLLAFQQLNVAGRHYYTAFITAFMIALAQYYFIRFAADSKSGYDILIIGFGGGLGALTAMKIHDRLKGWKMAKAKKLSTDYWENAIKGFKDNPVAMTNHDPSKPLGCYVGGFSYDEHENVIHRIELNEAGKKFIDELKGDDKNA